MKGTQQDKYLTSNAQGKKTKQADQSANHPTQTCKGLHKKLIEGHVRTTKPTCEGGVTYHEDTTSYIFCKAAPKPS